MPTMNPMPTQPARLIYQRKSVMRGFMCRRSSDLNSVLRRNWPSCGHVIANLNRARTRSRMTRHELMVRGSIVAACFFAQAAFNVAFASDATSAEFKKAVAAERKGDYQRAHYTFR